MSNQHINLYQMYLHCVKHYQVYCSSEYLSGSE